MLPDELYSIFLDNLKDPFVFVDNDHIIRYMNSVAANLYSEGKALIGRSILSCHNRESIDAILEIHGKMKNGLVEEIISDSEQHRIYMRGVRDREGNLIGYYERYEPPVTRY